MALALSGCGRPLTPAERSFAATVHGATLDADRVRVATVPFVGAIPRSRPARPRVACRERIARPESTPTVQVSTAAFVIFDTIVYAERLWRPDFLKDYPTRMDLRDAMTLSHELTHVWQWQNRRLTGYSPWRAVSEHRPGGDPYLFDLSENRSFLEFDFEQQGALVEEYVCCRALAPNGARTARLRALLSEVFPAIRSREAVAVSHIDLPSAEAALRAICA